MCVCVIVSSGAKSVDGTARYVVSRGVFNVFPRLRFPQPVWHSPSCAWHLRFKKYTATYRCLYILFDTAGNRPWSYPILMILCCFLFSWIQSAPKHHSSLSQDNHIFVDWSRRLPQSPYLQDRRSISASGQRTATHAQRSEATKV